MHFFCIVMQKIKIDKILTLEYSKNLHFFFGKNSTSGTCWLGKTCPNPATRTAFGETENYFDKL